MSTTSQVDGTPARDGAEGTLTRNALGVAGIVFLVAAAVAPLTAMTVIAPLGIALGNGGGIAGAFVLATLVLLLFGVGYAQMSRHITNTGAFYAYVTRAIGRPAGVATAYLAVLGYNSFMVGAAATSGFFTDLVLDTVFGINLPWQLWTAVSLVLVAILGRRGIDVSARVLGVSLVLEVLILVVLDISVLVQEGWSFSVFDPGLVFSGAFGIGLLFAFNCFVGFEAVALFGEEARNPKKTVPRATYAAVLAIGGFYVITSWAMVSAVGADQAGASANNVDAGGPGTYLIRVATDYLGTFLTDVLQLLLIVSLFAALLALHNATTRYLFALGRARLLPQAMARTNPRTGAPQVASGVQIAFDAIVILIFALAGADPLLDISASMTGFGTLGIVGLQGAAAVSVVVFFRRRADPRLWATAIAPGLGALGLITAFVLAIANFGTLAGSDSPVIGKLPWLVPVVLLIGLGMAAYLKSARPDVYAGLRQDTTAGSAEAEPLAGRPVAGTRGT